MICKAIGGISIVTAQSMASTGLMLSFYGALVKRRIMYRTKLKPQHLEINCTYILRSIHLDPELHPR